MSLEVQKQFLNVFYLLFTSQLFILIYSENATTLSFLSYFRGENEFLCDADETRATLKEGQYVNLHFESPRNICHIACQMQKFDKQRLIYQKDGAECASEDETTEEIRITKSLEGVWRCAVMIWKGVDSIKPIMQYKNIKYTTAHCNMSVYVDAPPSNYSKQKDKAAVDNNKPEMWIYISAGVGAVVAVIIIAQTVVMCYFKNKAKVAVKRSRLQNLSTKTYQEPPESDKARYSANPGIKPKRPKKRSDEETLYESVDDLTTVDSLKQRYGPTTPIEHRAPIPIPQILVEEEQYEDMDYEQSDTSPNKPCRPLNRSMMELATFPQRPPMPPPTDSLPRKPKTSHHIALTSPPVDKLPPKPFALSPPIPPSNLPPKPGSSKPVSSPHPIVKSNKQINNPNTGPPQSMKKPIAQGPPVKFPFTQPHQQAATFLPTVTPSMLNELGIALRKRSNSQNKPPPAPKPPKANQPTLVPAPTSIIPVNYEGPSDSFDSSDEEWTYEPLKDINYYIHKT